MSITLGRAAIGGGIAFASVLATAPFTPSPTLGPTDARAAAPAKAQTAAQAPMAPAASGNTPASAASSSSTAQSAKGAKGQGTSTKWTCPMHPHFIADEMGTCPICGMDLVKFETGPGSQAATGSEQRTIITVAPEVIQTMGVRIASAELSELGRQVRSFGTVIENQRLQTEVTARVEGWVEHLDVTAVGDQVKAGDRLFQLYSPQLVISQNDYMRSRETTELAERGISQLRAFGVQDKAIEEMRASRQPLQRVPLGSGWDKAPRLGHGCNER